MIFVPSKRIISRVGRTVLGTVLFLNLNALTHAGDRCSHTVTIRVVRFNQIEIKTTPSRADHLQREGILEEEGKLMLYWQFDAPSKKLSHTALDFYDWVSSVLRSGPTCLHNTQTKDIQATEYPLAGYRPIHDEMIESPCRRSHLIMFTLTDTH